MIRIDEDMVLLLHRMIAEETGGSPELRDRALLDSALQGAFQTFGGRDLFPTKEEKAATLGHALIANHAFVDGNKRIGMHVMLTFLEANGVPLRCAPGDIAAAGLAVAAGTMDRQGLLDWILARR
jgi:death-on-curing protein